MTTLSKELIHRLSVTMTFILMLAMSSLANAEKQYRTVETADADVEVRVFPADGNVLLLGFPCDEGKSIAEEKTAASLAQDGIEVWMPDMLSAFMLPNVRSSRAEIPTESILALIDTAITLSGEDITDEL